uniref:Uncharacterized protein n=1 Tax=Glossina austeni TaxID=7395 RepID=A0A1A9UTF1_GLOAU
MAIPSQKSNQTKLSITTMCLKFLSFKMHSKATAIPTAFTEDTIVSSKRTTLKLIWCTIVICCLNQQVSSTGIKDERNVQVQEFIDYMESLVLNTTNKALMKTRNIFQNFSQQIDANLTVAVEPLISDYITKVNEALEYNYNYTEKRKLLQLFRHEGQEMEKLRSLHNPEESAFRVQLISKEFINESRNLTDFDNLYLKFMQEFQKASGVLTAALRNSQEKEENYFELLTLLGDIKNERNLKEKDKLRSPSVLDLEYREPHNRMPSSDSSLPFATVSCVIQKESIRLEVRPYRSLTQSSRLYQKVNDFRSSKPQKGLRDSYINE